MKHLRILLIVAALVNALVLLFLLARSPEEADKDGDLGAVLQPRAVRLTGPATLAAAITSAGGTIRDAHVTQVAVIRGSLQQPQVALVNFDAIRNGRQPDVRIEPGDIIHVPVVPYEIFSRYLDLVLDTFVRTYSANEGARAIDRNAGRVGIVVPINSAR